MAGSDRKTSGQVSEKAEQIVCAARALFLADGFAATSMDAVAHESGVSKPTVYSHFQSKEGLFAGVIQRMCDEIAHDNFDGVPTDGPPAAVLKSVAQHICRYMVVSDQGRALLRTVICEVPTFPDLGRITWETGPQRAREMIAAYLAGLDAQGEAHVPDPLLAAGVFFGMVTGPFLIPVLLGAEKPPGKKELDGILDSIVEMFLKGIAV